MASASEHPRTTRDRQHVCRLLDADPELGEGLSPRDFELARRQLIVATAEADRRVDLALRDLLHRSSFGLLLLDGYLIATTSLAGRYASELLGPGDLLQPDVEDHFGAVTSVNRRALEPATVAVLSADFAQAVTNWPLITRRLQQRASRRVGHLSVLRALLFHPRLDVRLLLLFDHLAQRWGYVTPRGTRLRVPLTHEILADLVGARRPNVSATLSRLNSQGLLQRDGKGWILSVRETDLVGLVAQRTRRTSADPLQVMQSPLDAFEANIPIGGD